MWLIRLSIVTHRMKRVLRIGDAVSDMVQATRGITAGSGNPTTEMRVELITIVDEALEDNQCVGPTVYVDDISAAVARPDDFVEAHLVQFTKSVCDGIQAAGGEISQSK